MCIEFCIEYKNDENGCQTCECGKIECCLYMYVFHLTFLF